MVPRLFFNQSSSSDGVCTFSAGRESTNQDCIELLSIETTCYSCSLIKSWYWTRSCLGCAHLTSAPRHKARDLSHGILIYLPKEPALKPTKSNFKASEMAQQVGAECFGFDYEDGLNTYTIPPFSPPRPLASATTKPKRSSGVRTRNVSETSQFSPHC